MRMGDKRGSGRELPRVVAVACMGGSTNVLLMVVADQRPSQSCWRCRCVNISVVASFSASSASRSTVHSLFWIYSDHYNTRAIFSDI